MCENRANLSDAAAGIMERMANEPANRRIMYEILAFCRESREMKEISAYMASSIKDAAMHTYETYVSWLSELHALECSPEKRFHTTKEGVEVLCAASRENRLSFLLSERSELRGSFMSIMQACAEPKTKKEIEETLGCPVGETGFYPGYFISELENAGGLVWNGKWKTTDEGIKILISAIPNK